MGELEHGYETDKKLCSLCLFEPEVGEEWFIPACNDQHVAHWKCMESFKLKADDLRLPM